MIESAASQLRAKQMSVKHLDGAIDDKAVDCGNRTGRVITRRGHPHYHSCHLCKTRIVPCVDIAGHDRSMYRFSECSCLYIKLMLLTGHYPMLEALVEYAEAVQNFLLAQN